MKPQPEGGSLGESDRIGGESPRKHAELHKTITMAQIAKAAGVSQGAISSLLNDRDYGIRVSERTRERVFKVCREMGYIPNDLRAVVRMYPELGEYCLLVSTRRSAGLADPFITRIVSAAISATPAEIHSITISQYDETFDYLAKPTGLPQPIRAGIASKFILYGAPNPSLIQTLVKRGLAAVCLGHEVNEHGMLSLVPDYQLASRLGVEHLLQLGHRHVAIVSGPFGTTDPQIIELNRGVRLAFEQASLPIDAQNIVYGDLTHEAGVAAFETLMERTPTPTAIFCMSDSVAAGIAAAAIARGRAVPEDVSLVGCSNDSLAQFTCPPLTTVHIPAEEMACRAVEEVDRLVRETPLPPGRRETIPVRLIERESSRPPRDRS